jgi:hypothetical protein
MTCSIDNLTLLSSLKEKRQFQGFMNSWGADNIKSYKLNPDVYPYCESWLMTDGSYLQYANDTASTVPQVRLEFNPNKCNVANLLVLNSMFKNRRPSRVDVAIDFDQDLSRYLWLCPGMKSNRWYGRNGRLETLYYGASSSALQYRIYDKAVEQKAKGRTWWRVEAQSRYGPKDKVHLPVDLFQGLYAISPEQADYQDRAVVHYLREFPEQMPDVTRWHKAKLLALSDVGTDVINVNSIYQKSLGVLHKTVNLWVEQ